MRSQRHVFDAIRNTPLMTWAGLDRPDCTRILAKL